MVKGGITSGLPFAEPKVNSCVKRSGYCRLEACENIAETVEHLVGYEKSHPENADEFYQ